MVYCFSLSVCAGLIGLLTVPVFKALTGLPPYLGMLTSLGVLWVLTDAIHAGRLQCHPSQLSIIPMLHSHTSHVPLVSIPTHLERVLSPW